MDDLNFSFQNVIDANGVAIALTGMSIVFAALILIAVFVALLPRMLVWTHVVMPEKGGPVAPSPPARQEIDPATVAAIGAALHPPSRHSGG